MKWNTLISPSSMLEVYQNPRKTGAHRQNEQTPGLKSKNILLRKKGGKYSNSDSWSISENTSL